MIGIIPISCLTHHLSKQTAQVASHCHQCLALRYDDVMTAAGRRLSGGVSGSPLDIGHYDFSHRGHTALVLWLWHGGCWDWWINVMSSQIHPRRAAESQEWRATVTPFGKKIFPSDDWVAPRYRSIDSGWLTAWPQTHPAMLMCNT